MTIVYDLERGRVVWAGRDRTVDTMQRFLTWLGRRRARAVHTVCCDMWAIYIDAVRTHLLRATIVFDRFHVTQHLNRAVDDVRRQTWRQMQEREKAEFKRTRFLWLTNPENLQRDERTRLSALLRLNSPIVKAYLLKEDLRRFWHYRSSAWAEGHLRQWLWRAAHSRLAPFKKFARMLRTHLDGVLAWTRIRVTQRRPRRDEQQGEDHQPSRLWLSHRLDVHRQHLSLLCRASVTLTLFGDEPFLFPRSSMEYPGRPSFVKRTAC